MKVQDPLAQNLEEIRKIEGYTRDAKLAKVTYFRRKLG